MSHGTRLRLEWPQDGFVVSEGQEGSLTALIVNAGTQRWIDHNGEYYAIATLSDPSTGRELGNGDISVAGMGRDYDLAPGASVSIHVLIAGFGPVPPGRYRMTARTWPDLGLLTPPTTLTVRSS
jgi:hypothetical protein